MYARGQALNGNAKCALERTHKPVHGRTVTAEVRDTYPACITAAKLELAIVANEIGRLETRAVAEDPYIRTKFAWLTGHSALLVAGALHLSAVVNCKFSRG